VVRQGIDRDVAPGGGRRRPLRSLGAADRGANLGPRAPRAAGAALRPRVDARLLRPPVGAAATDRPGRCWLAPGVGLEVPAGLHRPAEAPVSVLSARLDLDFAEVEARAQNA